MQRRAIWLFPYLVMKKLICIICLLLVISCKPKSPYIPQDWFSEIDTVWVDTATINQIDNAETIDEIFPPEDEGLSYDEYFN